MNKLKRYVDWAFYISIVFTIVSFTAYMLLRETS